MSSPVESSPEAPSAGHPPTPAPDPTQWVDERFRTLAESIAGGAVVLFDGDLRYTWAAGQGLAEAGMEPDSLVGRTLHEVFPAELASLVEPQYRAALAGERVEKTVAHEGRWYATRGVPLPDTRGEGASGMVVTQDVTDWVTAEARAEKTQEMMLTAHKLEAVARLAGGVAHEFNNLLTGIRGYTQLLMEDRPLGHPDRDTLVKINRSVERATGLVAQLLAFGRQEFSQPQVMDLARLVDSCGDLLGSLLGETIRLDLDLVGSPQVEVDPRQFEQVLVNLAMNAKDAMPAGGTLRVSVDRVREPDGEGRGRLWGVVSVADTGEGMPPEVQERIFEPFFSTRRDGRGLGLGLSAVHGTMESHGGRVTVESAPGQGSLFRLYLPVAEAVGVGTGGGGADGGETQPARIMVVDDDDSVREVAARILRRLGYEVDEASSGSRALARLLEMESPPELLLTDVVMPGMTGRELVDQVRLHLPQVHTLYMSAYTEDDVIRKGVRVAEVNFLPKPFTLESLAEAVRRALES